MSDKPPLIFLTFANNKKSFLDKLKQESRDISNALLSLKEKGIIDIWKEDRLENEDIPNLLVHYTNRITIFHYGGHADGQQLVFEDKMGNTEGIVGLLKFQSNLKLVFLNACETYKQVEQYLELGVGAILATTLPIKDEQASQFAKWFYQSLSKGFELKEAYLFACSSLVQMNNQYGIVTESIYYFDLSERSVITKKMNYGNDSPWKLFIHSEKKDVLNWKITNSELVREVNFDSQELPILQQGSRKSKIWQIIPFIIISTLGIIGVVIFSLDCLNNISQGNSHALTVFVHGMKSKNDLILKGTGQVEITYGTKKAREDINNKGQAIFNEIPSFFFKEDARSYINICETNGEPYQAIYPDSLYKLTPRKPIWLPVILKGLDKIFGTAIYKDKPLEGVIVSVGLLRDTTNDMGFYELLIPDSLQNQKQEVKFFKSGFELKIKNAYPQTNANLNIIMSK